MSMGRRREKQASLWVAAPSLPRSPGHRFYEKLNELLRENGFDRAMEAACAKYFEADGTAGRPSIAPGLYFRMLLVGFFEGIESERGLEWRCSDSLSLREFLGLLPGETVPDHSTMSKMRKRLGSEVFETMFAFVLGVVNRSGLLQGKVMGVDSTYLRADASMKAIVRRETGEVYAEFIKRLAKEEGIENPTVEDARRLDRTRKGKKTSNADWKSATDEDARIAKLKDGRTRLAYKTEHVVDMSTGVVVAAEVYPADQADPATMAQSLEQARTNVEQAKSDKDRDSDDEPPPEGGSSDVQPERTVIEVVADKGYHKTELLLSLKECGYRTYIPERSQPVRKWEDKGWDMQQAFYGNRYRVRRPKGRALQRKRGELIERTFAHACETGAMRRVRVRGRENVRKRYLAHVAALNLGLVLRQMLGAGTPRGLAEARKGFAAAVLMVWAAMVALVGGMPRHLARFSRSAWRAMGPGEVRDIGSAIAVA
jgi:transposase